MDSSRRGANCSNDAGDQARALLGALLLLLRAVAEPRPLVAGGKGAAEAHFVGGSPVLVLGGSFNGGGDVVLALKPPPKAVKKLSLASKSKTTSRHTERTRAADREGRERGGAGRSEAV